MDGNKRDELVLLLLGMFCAVLAIVALAVIHVPVWAFAIAIAFVIGLPLGLVALTKRVLVHPSL